MGGLDKPIESFYYYLQILILINEETMFKEFKTLLKHNGQSLKWFYDIYMPDTTLAYPTVHQQLNGYYKTISEEIITAVGAYMHTHQKES
jgi:hypothetical protein